MEQQYTCSLCFFSINTLDPEEGEAEPEGREEEEAELDDREGAEEEGAVKEKGDMWDVGAADLQPEEQTILDSLRLKATVDGKRRHLQEAEVEYVADSVEMSEAMVEEEEESGPSYAPIYPTHGTHIVDISHNE
ncbi:hypothetical protein D1007_45811 [Hordeum vulgare]|nr:hypothetical protein D1007_45811 [Hordeum vulgare]